MQVVERAACPRRPSPPAARRGRRPACAARPGCSTAAAPSAAGRIGRRGAAALAPTRSGRRRWPGAASHGLARKPNSPSRAAAGDAVARTAPRCRLGAPRANAAPTTSQQPGERRAVGVQGEHRHVRRDLGGQPASTRPGPTSTTRSTPSAASAGRLVEAHRLAAPAAQQRPAGRRRRRSRSPVTVGRSPCRRSGRTLLGQPLGRAPRPPGRPAASGTRARRDPGRGHARGARPARTTRSTASAGPATTVCSGRCSRR